MWLWATAVALAALVAFALVRPRSPLPIATPLGAAPPSSVVKVSIASSSTKQEWLGAAVDAFNRASLTQAPLQVAGHPVAVEVLKEDIDGKKADYRSGTMVTDTLAGKIKPTVLSPGEESWISQLEREWRAMNGAPIAREAAPVVARTPLVLAMWRSRATELGCWPVPQPQCTWQRIRDLAVDSAGWGALGRPEWQKLKLGYSYFGESNSGTLGVVAMCLIGSGKADGLDLADVEPDSGCGQFIHAVEAAKAHSGKKSDWLLERMVQGGPDYLDAAITWETEVIQLNQKFAKELREPLVAVYPQDGTLLVGHPYAILDGAPWVTPDQDAGAKLFRAFLLSREQQERVVATGLRPGDTAIRLSSPIAPAFGASPDVTLRPLSVPAPLVVDRIREVWEQVRKHALVAIVFDKSGSMQSASKIRSASKGASEFVHEMNREDILMWMPFDDKVYPGSQGRNADVGERLISDISSIGASGGTALYDAVLLAFERISERRRELGASYRYGIVVLSDGQDGNSRRTLSMLEAALRPTESDPTGIQVHTIAIGNDADERVLQRIASAAHGRYWRGQTESEMVAIYREIAKHY
jgi:Ca-activated chloride channel family protein